MSIFSDAFAKITALYLMVCHIWQRQRILKFHLGSRCWSRSPTTSNYL